MRLSKPKTRELIEDAVFIIFCVGIFLAMALVTEGC